MATRKERRRYQRLPWPATIQIHPTGELMAMWQEVAIIDVGAGGCRFVAPEPIEKGERLELRLHLPTWQAPAEITVRVIWVRASKDVGYEIGVEFADATPEQLHRVDDMIRFLSQRAA